MNTTRARFEAKFIPEPNSGCWLWLGALNRQGYGKLALHGRRGTFELAHRTAWRLYHGPLPADVLVCHACDMPTCVNPDHLWLGTHQDNVRDCMQKGRLASCQGSDNARAILNERQVREILNSGSSIKALAATYGVSRSTIYAVLSGQNWSDLYNAHEKTWGRTT